MSRTGRFVDSEGFTWQVQEVADARGARRTLYFFSRYLTKKLSDFPSGWTTMRWWELEELCDQARPLASEMTAFPQTTELRTV